MCHVPDLRLSITFSSVSVGNIRFNKWKRLKEEERMKTSFETKFVCRLTPYGLISILIGSNININPYRTICHLLFTCIHIHIQSTWNAQPIHAKVSLWIDSTEVVYKWQNDTKTLKKERNKKTNKQETNHLQNIWSIITAVYPRLVRCQKLVLWHK